MGIKDKAAAIDFSKQPKNQPAAVQPPAEATSAKTGPGILNESLVHRREALMSETQRQLDDAKAALKEFDGAAPTRHLDPNKVLPSRWANRHEKSFTSAAFQQLKDEIAQAGGNVQPIKVRKSRQDPEQFELVFGHRRHRACLELGLPVLAMVVDIDDVALWQEMERENRARSDLSPWEQGVMYKRALDEGLFPSRRKLAESIGVDQSQVAKVVALTELPREVISAFASPTDIQVNWASSLRAAVDRDPDTVSKIAQSMGKGETAPKTPREVFKALTEASTTSVESFNTQRDLHDRLGNKIGTIKAKKGGKYCIELVLPDSSIEAIEQALQGMTT